MKDMTYKFRIEWDRTPSDQKLAISDPLEYDDVLERYDHAFEMVKRGREPCPVTAKEATRFDQWDRIN